MDSPLIITSPTTKRKPEVDRTKDPQSNPIPRPERPPSPSLTKLVDIGIEDGDNDLERRNRLILRLQDEVMQYAKENKNLRLENHKLKQHNAWMKDRLKYTGNTGRIKLENDVDVVLRENASLKAQIYDLKGEIADFKQLEKTSDSEGPNNDNTNKEKFCFAANKGKNRFIANVFGKVKTKSRSQTSSCRDIEKCHGRNLQQDTERKARIF